MSLTDLIGNLQKNDTTLTTFHDTDAGEVKDWLPTLLPAFDYNMLGGIPLSGKINEIFGKPSTGKSLANYTLIPFQDDNGDIDFKKLKDIKVGDKVFNRLGKPISVLGVYPQEKKLNTYDVILEDGRSLHVNDEHLWTIISGKTYKEVTTADIIEMLDSEDKVYIPRNHSVKNDNDINLVNKKQEFSEKYHINNKKTDTTLLFDSYSEANDCYLLALELGYRATSTLNHYSNRYEVHISTWEKNKIEIKKVINLHQKTDMTCLYVDDPEHVFMAGDFVVTHNTTFAGTLMKNGLKMDVPILFVYFDVEGTTSATRLEELGVDSNRILTVKPKVNKDGTAEPLTIEQIGNKMIDILADVHAQSPETIVMFFWDSIAFTQSKMQSEYDVDAQLVGQQAKALTGVSRKIQVNLIENNGALLAFNQARDNINAPNPKYAQTLTTGGKGWEHVLSTRISLASGVKITRNSSDKTPIGKETKVKIVKSKIGDNFGQEFTVAILGKDGYDFEYNVVLEGQDIGLVTKGNYPHYTTDNGEIIKGRNMVDLVSKFKDPNNFEILKELWQKEIKYYFPNCYPPLFNTTAKMSVENFPIIEGLRNYYQQKQEELPIEKQNYNYLQYKEHGLPFD